MTPVSLVSGLIVRWLHLSIWWLSRGNEVYFEHTRATRIVWFFVLGCFLVKCHVDVESYDQGVTEVISRGAFPSGVVCTDEEEFARVA